MDLRIPLSHAKLLASIYAWSQVITLLPLSVWLRKLNLSHRKMVRVLIQVMQKSHTEIPSRELFL